MCLPCATHGCISERDARGPDVCDLSHMRVDGCAYHLPGMGGVLTMWRSQETMKLPIPQIAQWAAQRRRRQVSGKHSSRLGRAGHCFGRSRPIRTARTQTRNGWRIGLADVSQEHEEQEKDPVLHRRHRVRNVDHPAHPGKDLLLRLIYAQLAVLTSGRQYVLSGSRQAVRLRRWDSGRKKVQPTKTPDRVAPLRRLSLRQ